VALTQKLPAEDPRTMLQALVQGFDRDAKENRELIRGLLDDDRQAFFSNAVEILKTGTDSRGAQCLVALLVTNDLLLPTLCDPTLTREQALSLARVAVRVDSTADVVLARRLADCVSGGGSIQPEDTSRLLDILGEISDGTRILPSLMRVMRHSDPHLRSKAVLIIGRGSRSVTWAQRRLSEEDHRVRANAVEALWGLDSAAARELLHFASHDQNNRVAGNALLGLYWLGDCTIIPEILKMAVHDSSLFRSTAAWIMGETGDPRFTETLAGLIKEPNNAVRKRGFVALGQIKAAIAQTLQASHWRVAGLFVGSNAREGSRRLQLAVVSEDGHEQPRIRPTEIILSEEGRQVVNYKVVERPMAQAVSLFLAMPRSGGPPGSPWNKPVLACLRWKRTSDLWALMPYLPTGEGDNPNASLAEEPVRFHSNPDGVTAALATVPARSDCTDLWSAIWRSVRTDSEPVRGKRHVIIFSNTEEAKSAGLGLISATLSSRALVQVISTVPNLALENFCRRVHGNFQIAATDEEIAPMVAQAYVNLLARYDVSYHSACPEAPALKIRVHAPSGWGELELPIPTRPLEEQPG
jgi:HEAT repeat protein